MRAGAMRMLAGVATGVMALAGPAWAQSAPERPTSGTLVSAEAGDVACYLRIRDGNGQTRNWMASFEMCEGAEARVGRHFALSWRAGNVLYPSCQGNMDCGRSLRVMLIDGMQPLPR